MSVDRADLKIRRYVVLGLLLVQVILLLYAMKGLRPPKDIRVVEGYTPWSEEVLEAAGDLPVQSGGKVKPLSVHANFYMLKLHGSRTMKIRAEEGGEVIEIGPVAMYLDTLFRPDLAMQLPVFLVDDSDLVEPLGVKVDKKRARYSYEQFVDSLEQFTAEGNKLRKKENETKTVDGDSDLTDDEEETLAIADKVSFYDKLISSFIFSREKMVPDGAELELPQDLGDARRFSSWMRMYPSLGAVMRQGNMKEIPPALNLVLRKFSRGVQAATIATPMAPPLDDEEDTWLTYGRRLDGLITALQKGEYQDEEWKHLAADLELVEDVALAVGTDEELSKMLAWKQNLRARTESRGEDKKFGLEQTYYKLDYFYHTLRVWIVAFLLAAFSWFAPKSSWGRWLNLASLILLVGGILYASAGVIHRSVVMERPPVANLYDTIPFCTIIAVIIFALLEYVTRRRIMMVMAIITGVVGMFVTMRYEIVEGKDTMGPLRAVLRSNFWLATHVVMIAIGYSGALMTCFLSTVYVYLRLAGFYDDDAKMRRFYTRSVYGLTCFTLFFSLVGTVLGGIWANDSWGRFWGWDPKENGALLIVLWCLIILHARMAGWIREWGIHICSIFGGIVVAFSWWGVNMLEIGLHSYGHTKGAESLFYFYYLELAAIVVGFIAMFVSRSQKSSQGKG